DLAVARCLADRCAERGSARLADALRCRADWPTVEAIEGLTAPEGWSVERVGTQTRRVVDAMVQGSGRARPGRDPEDRKFLAGGAALMAPGSAHGLALGAQVLPKE